MSRVSSPDRLPYRGNPMYASRHQSAIEGNRAPSISSVYRASNVEKWLSKVSSPTPRSESPKSSLDVYKSLPFPPSPWRKPVQPPSSPSGNPRHPYPLTPWSQHPWPYHHSRTIHSNGAPYPAYDNMAFSPSNASTFSQTNHQNAPGPQHWQTPHGPELTEPTCHSLSHLGIQRSGLQSPFCPGGSVSRDHCGPSADSCQRYHNIAPSPQYHRIDHAASWQDADEDVETLTSRGSISVYDSNIEFISKDRLRQRFERQRLEREEPLPKPGGPGLTRARPLQEVGTERRRQPPLRPQDTKRRYEKVKSREHVRSWTASIIKFIVGQGRAPERNAAVMPRASGPHTGRRPRSHVRGRVRSLDYHDSREQRGYGKPINQRDCGVSYSGGGTRRASERGRPRHHPGRESY